MSCDDLVALPVADALKLLAEVGLQCGEICNTAPPRGGTVVEGEQRVVVAHEKPPGTVHLVVAHFPILREK